MHATCPEQFLRYKKESGAHLFGKPRMQILIPSSTPLQVSWCMMRGGSTPPGCLCVLGTMHLMLMLMLMLMHVMKCDDDDHDDARCT